MNIDRPDDAEPRKRSRSSLLTRTEPFPTGPFFSTDTSIMQLPHGYGYGQPVAYMPGNGPTYLQNPFMQQPPYGQGHTPMYNQQAQHMQDQLPYGMQDQPQYGMQDQPPFQPHAHGQPRVTDVGGNPTPHYDTPPQSSLPAPCTLNVRDVRFMTESQLRGALQARGATPVMQLGGKDRLRDQLYRILEPDTAALLLQLQAADSDFTASLPAPLSPAATQRHTEALAARRLLTKAYAEEKVRQSGRAVDGEGRVQTEAGALVTARIPHGRRIVIMPRPHNLRQTYTHTHVQVALPLNTHRQCPLVG